jgi:hypothetical protein
MEGQENWVDFNVALGAGSAALAGLIMVAISVNIKEVLSFPGFSARAAAALSLVVLTLTASLIALIPAQPLTVDGVLILAVALVAWAITFRALITLVRQAEPAAAEVPAGRADTGRRVPRRSVHLLLNVLLFIGPLALITVGALQLILSAPAGSHWVALGSIGALAAAVVFSWIALVEVLR